MNTRVLILGGGYNVLVAAAYLAGAGLPVQFFERRPFLGGASTRTPADLEAEEGLTNGCITHVPHSGAHLFWNRPLPELAHYRAPLPGLYLCGSVQHPGGEVSGQPGHNAAMTELRDLEGAR